MSAIVKTATPFLNKELLLQALENIGCKYTLQGNDILTDRKDYYGIQKFSLSNGRYVFLHDRDSTLRNINNQQYKSVSEFLQAVGEEYEKLYQKKLEELERQRLEEEQKRLEQERLAYIENVTNQITQKAKEEGYTIKKEKVKDKVKIVLTRNTYR
jgi:hypothetical protein